MKEVSAEVEEDDAALFEDLLLAAAEVPFAPAELTELELAATEDVSAARIRRALEETAVGAAREMVRVPACHCSSAG